MDERHAQTTRHGSCQTKNRIPLFPATGCVDAETEITAPPFEFYQYQGVITYDLTPSIVRDSDNKAMRNVHGDFTHIYTCRR